MGENCHELSYASKAHADPIFAKNVIAIIDMKYLDRYRMSHCPTEFVRDH